MGLAQAIHPFSEAEYYDLEVKAEYKSEYYAGEIFAMAGGTFRHSQIVGKTFVALTLKLRGKRCTPYDSNVRIKVPATGLITYPDASVFCPKPEADPKDKYKQTATNPSLVVEVLSKSTEGYDRGKKAENYRQIESLRAYMLVSQTEPHVELYERHGDGFWFLTEASGMDATLKISCLEIELSLAEIYDGVDFSEPDEA